MDIIIRNYTATWNKNCANYTAKIQNNTADIYLDLYQTAQDLELFASVKVSANDELNYRTIVKRGFKICKFLKTPHREFFFNIYYQQLVKNGHWFTKCPIEAVSFFFYFFM